MDNSGDELGQVLGIGEHCAVEHCRQVDFLPFKCDCCYRVFCLEHRSYGSHACPKAGEKETTVIVCPLCAKCIRLERAQDANLAFEAHQREGCDPSNYDRVHKKPRCPVAGCKEKLTTINAYRCKHCAQRVCLRHRDPGDHGCATAQAAARQQRSVPRAAPAPSTSRPQPPASAPSAPSAPSRRLNPDQAHAAALRQYQDPDNSLRGTAQRRMAQLQQQQQQQQQTQQFRWPWQQPSQPSQPEPQLQRQTQQATAAAVTTTAANRVSNSNANPLIPPHLPERCPQCDARFATVERLVQHVEDFHPSVSIVSSSNIGNNTQGGGGSGGDNTASATFTNPLRGLLGGTIAGGEAPVGPLPSAPGRGATLPPAIGAGGGGGGGGGAGAEGEVFRCYHCARTFSDPVLLVQHSERCAGSNRTAAAGGQGGGGGGGGADARDGCIMS